MASILDFRSEHYFLSIFDLQVTPKLPTPVRVNWPFSSEDARNRLFTRWPPCHLRFPIETILPTFYLSVTPMLPAKFRVNLPFASGEEAKNRFSRWSTWWPSWMSNRTILAIFWSTSHSDASYQVYKVNKPFDSGEKAKNSFPKWPPWRTSWISDRKDFSYFWPISQPAVFYQVPSQLAFQFRRRSEK